MIQAFKILHDILSKLLVLSCACLYYAHNNLIASEIPSTIKAKAILL